MDLLMEFKDFAINGNFSRFGNCLGATMQGITTSLINDVITPFQLKTTLK